jgi:hypothetical protein
MGLNFDIDMENLFPKVWFGDTPGKRVCLQLCPPEKVDEFRQSCLTTKSQAVKNSDTRRMEIVEQEKVDITRFGELLNDYCIVEWDLKDVKGKSISCTSENKKKLMGVPVFASFIRECLDELGKLAGVAKEEEVKNFVSSQEG